MTFDPWRAKTKAVVGRLSPSHELSIDVSEFDKLLERLNDQGIRHTKAIEQFGGFVVRNTRYNYFDSDRHIGVACGEYGDFSVLQSLRRFVLQNDSRQHRKNVAATAMATNGATTFENDSNEDDDKSEEDFCHEANGKRQVPRENMQRFLDMNVFNGTNVKNILQSGKSMLYYQLTFLLPNCMRMYVLPGPQLCCFSAVLPLNSLCTIFDLNPRQLPKECIVPIERTPYSYLSRTLRVKYLFSFSANVSFLDRRDPVIHDGGIDTCDKLFLSDDEFSDFRINCTLNCRNRNEDYDGDTNNPGFCKGIESATEIRFNMRTQLMSFTRNRHNFSQNILYRTMVLLCIDSFAPDSFLVEVAPNSIRRNKNLTLEHQLYNLVTTVVRKLDVDENVNARRRVRKLLGERYENFYYLYFLPLLRSVKKQLNDESLSHMERVNASVALWSPSKLVATANCFNLFDNVTRSMSLLLGDNETTQFIDNLLRVVHDRVPYVFSGYEPLCLSSVISVLSHSKGTFDDILSLQRIYEHETIYDPNDLMVPAAMKDLIRPMSSTTLARDKQYLDNFVYGSKKIPKNSKLAISTKWTMQNIIYHDGDLYDDGTFLLEDCLRFVSYDLLMDVDLIRVVFLSVGRSG